jgi:very-short-patch-repair endonuclease
MGNKMTNQYKERTIICKGCGKTITKRMPEGRNCCSLECYRKSKKPQRKTGKMINCAECGKQVYKSKCHLNRSKKLFCSQECANKYQGRNKIKYICKTCGKTFRWSKSRENQTNPTYCSIKCRNNDTEHMMKCGLSSTLKQQRKRGLNKLELAGRKILRDLKIDFNEQVLMFDKFLVDVLLKNKKIIIQWDGEHWHNRPKRKQLDISQDAYLDKCGYKVLRITDKQIKNDLEGVYANIRRTIQ